MLMIPLDPPPGGLGIRQFCDSHLAQKRLPISCSFIASKSNMANAAIKFGTSGWRAIVADEFTHNNVRRAVTGIARHVMGQKKANVGNAGPRIIIGRDPRYMGETFVAIAAEILAAHR